MDLSVLMANVFTMPFTVMAKMIARMEVMRRDALFLHKRISLRKKIKKQRFSIKTDHLVTKNTI